jgi:Reverse transcriptase (RNA-dependent DNA polymerase)
LCKLQSVYRIGHSTETALVELLDGVYSAGDRREIAVVVGHLGGVRHHLSWCPAGSAYRVRHSPYRSGLVEKIPGRPGQFVKIGNHSSPLISCSSGVPQGSVLDPLLFAVYVSPIDQVIASHSVRYHKFADDTQLYLPMEADDFGACLATLASRVSAVKLWYLQNCLLLSADKYEATMSGTDYQLRSALNVECLSVAGTVFQLTSTIKSLGDILDQ